MNVKPMLADDYVEEKLRFPLWVQPKTDGVRGLHLGVGLTGRSLKAHKNLHTTAYYSRPEFCGLDGELFLGPEGNITSPRLCRDTTGALNSIQGAPDIFWKCFDYITESSVGHTYRRRYDILRQYLEVVRHPRLILCPTQEVRNLNELNKADEVFLAQGYEGTILRDPDGLYKSGRSTVREGGLLRIKRFIEEEALVLAIIEGQSNGNEATTNELGRTERSSHQENMTPNGMVGALLCREIKTGMEITVSAGSMDHEDRLRYFNHPELIVGKIIKFKHFPKGRKDLPRFPTFASIRAESDIS